MGWTARDHAEFPPAAFYSATRSLLSPHFNDDASGPLTVELGVKHNADRAATGFSCGTQSVAIRAYAAGLIDDSLLSRHSGLLAGSGTLNRGCTHRMSATTDDVYTAFIALTKCTAVLAVLCGETVARRMSARFLLLVCHKHLRTSLSAFRAIRAGPAPRVPIRPFAQGRQIEVLLP